MKNRHYYLTIFLLLLVFCSCEKEETEIPLFLKIDESTLTTNLPSSQTSKVIFLQSNCPTLNVLSDESWCKISSINIEKGNFMIEAEENSSFIVRSANLTISAEHLKETIMVTQLGNTAVIILSEKIANVGILKSEIDIELTTNTEVEVSVSDNWIKQLPTNKSFELVDMTFSFEIEAMSGESNERTGYVYFTNSNKSTADTLTVKQGTKNTEGYVPIENSEFEKDEELPILSASLTPSNMYQGAQGIDKAIDGDESTIFHSPWAGMTEGTEISLEFVLDPANASIADYIVLQPRTSGSNGIIKTATVWVSTQENEEYIQIHSIEASQSNTPYVVRFDTPILNPRKFKIIVSDGWGDPEKYFVSLAEFKCYENKSNNSIAEDLKYFTDKTCSELVSGTTVENIASISNPFIQNVASYLYSGIYSTEYRVQEYQAYRSPQKLASELKTSTYSQFENPTGMYLTNEKEVVVFVGETNGENISLRIKNFGEEGSDETHRLNEGVNLITPKVSGNTYINYYTDNYEIAEPVKIHIASGEVNGYFDKQKHTEDDGKLLLSNAVSPILDIVGDRVTCLCSVVVKESGQWSNR